MHSVDSPALVLVSARGKGQQKGAKKVFESASVWKPALAPEWAQQSARVWALCSDEASAQAWVSGEEETQLLVMQQGNP